jgi:hypothetical protein
MSREGGAQEIDIHQSESERSDPIGPMMTQDKQSETQDESQTPVVHNMDAETGEHTLVTADVSMI